MPGRLPCLPDCECSKHSRGPHPSGCECALHTKVPHPLGCMCKRHPWGKRSDDENARRWRSNYYITVYGVDLEHIEALLNDQDGGCYLCGTPISLDIRGSFHVDHDHACCPKLARKAADRVPMCGKCVLGLACARCNKGVGMFNDDPDLMMRVAERRMAKMLGLHQLADDV